MELKNKTAIITGAAGGIGQATTKLFAAAGANLVLVDYNAQALDQIVLQTRENGVNVAGLAIDVSIEQQVQSVVKSALEQFSRIDILVNNAGICKMTPIADISVAEWDHYLAVNLRSVFLFSREVFKHMKENKYGKIINIGSAAGKIGGLAAGAHYSASKAGVICFTKSLALQAAPYKINVNCVCPGPTETELTDEWGKKVNAEFADKIPMKKYASPKDIAETILFLATDKTSYITGEVLDVNGGLVMD